jgi:hypothetical protein
VLILRRKFEAINVRFTTLNRKELTMMNKFLSFLVAVLAIAQTSAFMGQPVFSQQRTVRDFVAIDLRIWSYLGNSM